MPAAIHATEDEIKIMQNAITVMDKAMDNADEYVEADLEFHLALAKASQNPLVPILIDPIVDLLQEQRKRIFLVEGGPQRGQNHHRRILGSVIARDPATARQEMIIHLAQVRNDSMLATTDTS